MALRLLTPPATEPVLLADAKTHVRQTQAMDDALITALIVAARQTTENILGRALITQTWQLTLDSFPTRQIFVDRFETQAVAIQLPYPPLISIDSIKFKDTTNTLQTLSTVSYTVDDRSEPGWVVPAYGYDWPDTWTDVNSVTIQYQCGYGGAAAVPQAIKQYILLLVGHYYENRESSQAIRISGGQRGDVAMVGNVQALPFIDGLLDPYRLARVF